MFFARDLAVSENGYYEPTLDIDGLTRNRSRVGIGLYKKLRI